MPSIGQTMQNSDNDLKDSHSGVPQSMSPILSLQR